MLCTYVSTSPCLYKCVYIFVHVFQLFSAWFLFFFGNGQDRWFECGKDRYSPIGVLYHMTANFCCIKGMLKVMMF